MTDTIATKLIDGQAYRRAQQCALDIMWRTKAAVSVDEANRYVLAAIDDGNYDGPMDSFEGNLEIIYYPNDTNKFKVFLETYEEEAHVVITRTVSTTYEDTYVVPKSMVKTLKGMSVAEVRKHIEDEGYTLECDDPIASWLDDTKVKFL